MEHEIRGFSGGSVVNTGDVRDAGSIPGLERSPGEGSAYLLQCSCLENFPDSGAGKAI